MYLCTVMRPEISIIYSSDSLKEKGRETLKTENNCEVGNYDLQ